MTIYKGLEAMRNNFRGVSVEQYLDIPEKTEDQTDYQRGVVDTLYYLARQILYLDKNYEGKTEEELTEAIGRYMQDVLTNIPWSDDHPEAYELVLANALLQTIGQEKPYFK